LTSSTSIDSSTTSAASILDLDYHCGEEFSLDSFFLDEPCKEEPLGPQNKDPLHHPEAADTTFPEMTPFEWSNAALEWSTNQFDQHGQVPNIGVGPHHHLQGDMRVLGVDLDMLMQNGPGQSDDTFFETMTCTPPPSPDSSTAKHQILSSFDPLETSVQSKVIHHRSPPPPHTAHHMACHDYTNKVHYQMPPIVVSRPMTTLVSSTTALTTPSPSSPIRHILFGPRQKYGRPSSGKAKGSNRKSKSSIEDPEYLAHGTGIPR
jgi:hypothetical protein